MLEHCKSERLNPDWATIVSSGNIEVVETVVSGAARVVFTVESPSLHLKHLDNKPPLKWAANRRCADGAIAVEFGDELHLHVIELKSKLTRKEWLGVKQQLEGMIANAIAALAVIGAPRPIDVVCHVSFLDETVTSISTPDLILLKLPVGGSTILGDVEDWKSGRTELFGYTDIQIRKIPRDRVTGTGHGDLSAPSGK